jgi:hypothetical protein
MVGPMIWITMFNNKYHYGNEEKELQFYRDLYGIHPKIPQHLSLDRDLYRFLSFTSLYYLLQ